MNIEVARDSIVIVLASGRDSAAVKTVAILTIDFLPGTSVAVSTPISLNTFNLVIFYLV